MIDGIYFDSRAQEFVLLYCLALCLIPVGQANTHLACRWARSLKAAYSIEGFSRDPGRAHTYISTIADFFYVVQARLPKVTNSGIGYSVLKGSNRRKGHQVIIHL